MQRYDELWRDFHRSDPDRGGMMVVVYLVMTVVLASGVLAGILIWAR